MEIRKCGDGRTMFVRVEDSDRVIQKGKPADAFIVALEQRIPTKQIWKADDGYYMSIEYEGLIRDMKTEHFPTDENQTSLF
jgi:hypothetical protein